jgi:pimeloyl-ACP methyl ester carboxylesterase
MSMSTTITPTLITRDHLVDGLFVKEVSPALPGGPATPLLMVHGGLHGWWAWEAWMGLLAASGWRCFAMSLRNHTDSRSVPDDAYFALTVADYVADVDAVMRWLGARPVLIGHSMGGIVVQKAAEARAAAGLVLVCSVGPGQLGGIRPPLPTDRGFSLDAQAARALWFREIDDAAFAAFHRRLVPESPGVLNDYSGGKLGVDRARIGCPILAIGAEHDATPVHRAPAIAAFYGGDCLVVAGAAHNMMMESPALPVAMRINEWLLRRIDGPACHWTSGQPPADIGRNASAPGTVEISL